MTSKNTETTLPESQDSSPLAKRQKQSHQGLSPEARADYERILKDYHEWCRAHPHPRGWARSDWVITDTGLKIIPKENIWLLGIEVERDFRDWLRIGILRWLGIGIWIGIFSVEDF